MTNVFDKDVGVTVGGRMVGVAGTLAEMISVGVDSTIGKSMIGFPPKGVGV